MRRICFILALAACNDSGGTPPVDAPGGSDAYDTARCLIAGHYGALGSVTGTTAQGPTTLTVTLDPGPPRDTFFLKLNAGKGVFADALANGTYPLAGADLDFNNCGLCVNLIADIVAMQGPSKFYFATAGSVTLTSTSPPAGTLSNLTFTEVSVAGTPVVGGCTASITSMAFSM
ncbi:MAG: hypothetical protein SFX73_09775 [Kofleriaceae bacterium]|nr:hypothetical protein [Kofleriaceae bacterium]